MTDTAARQYTEEAALPVARSSGSGLGILNMLVGASDAGAASRKIKGSDYEKADCDPSNIGEDGAVNGECQGVLPVETSIGNDLLAIIVPADDPRTTISLSEVNSIFGSPTEGTTLCVPDPTSGTYSFFVDNAVEPDASSLPGFADDAALTSCVASNPNAIGFVGISWASRDPGVKALSVDGVDPNTVTDLSTYPFARPLLLYTDGNQADSASGVATARFICSILTDAGQALVEEVGYRTLSADALSTSRASIGCDSLPAPATVYDGPLEQLKYCRDSQTILQLGSSTVFPVATELSDRQTNTFLTPMARSAGSSLGIQTLLAGALDIGTASRALKGSDYESLGCDPADVTADGIATASCQGILPVGNRVGDDALAMIVNKNNPIEDATLEQLVALFAGATGGSAPTWNAALGSPPQAPAFYGEPVQYFIPDTLSGTNAFAADVLGSDFTIDGFNDDEPIVKGVSENDGAIGFVGASFVTGAVKAISVGGVDPTSGDPSYAFTRPLYFYSNQADDASNKIVEAWNCVALSDFGQEQVARVGYLPLSADAITAQKDKLALSCPDDTE